MSNNLEKDNIRVYSDVYTTGYFVISCLEKKSLAYFNTNYVETSTLLKIISGELNDTIFILNNGLPWLELDNWYKVKIPPQSFLLLIMNNEVIYNDGKTLITATKSFFGEI
ncbi:MAG: hypothetical protein QXW36_02770 [Desulfurococcaceae archaeon]